MKVSQSVKLAGIVVALIALYFLVASLFGAGGGENTAAPETGSTFTVLTTAVSPESWRDEIVVRGRTQAERKVTVRAETSGAVLETPAEQGEIVEKGHVICRLNVDARRAQLGEARAAFEKAELDYKAATKLFEDGFRAETGVAAAKASRDQAAAAMERAALELQKTDIKAPFEGVFDRRYVEVGDFMAVGDPCATIIQHSPFLVVGAVSEQDVNKITKDDRGVARLATGEVVEGRVRLVSSTADPATRTFDVELEIPNEDGALRDGVTAEFRVFAEERNAHRVPRSALVLDDGGDIGVRTIGSGNAVVFAPVTMIGETPSGVWVSGLEGDVTLIVRGQEYVSAGQIVETASADDTDTPS
ncbi:efflux RND transporter periplasmic adaptor subunit [Hyphococcus sp.]|uniref:efflux RND transporter periplasmic adaptor subunit n=1 Tax=Hyphococcus sp. TaxID=2038636 RepID=UPI003CCB9AA5